MYLPGKGGGAEKNMALGTRVQKLMESLTIRGGGAEFSERQGRAKF